MPPTLSPSSSSNAFRVARWARYALLAVPVGIGLGAGCGGKGSNFTGGSGGTGTSTNNSSGTTGTGMGGNIFAGTSTTTTTSSGGPGGGVTSCESGTPTKGPNQWAQKNSETTGTQNVLGVATDVSNNVLVAGAAGRNSSVTLGSLPAVANSADANNAFAAKLGPDGTPAWAQGFTVTGSAGSNGVIGSGALAVTADTSGNVWVGGYFNGTMTVTGTTTPTITSQPSGHVFPNAFVAEFNSMGEVQALERLGNPSTTVSNGGGAAQVQGLATHSTATGEVIAIVGKFEAQLDLTIYPNGPLLQAAPGNNQPAGFLIVQRTADESIVFAAQFGDGSGQGGEANGVAFDAAGDVLVTGDTYVPIGFPSGGPTLTPAGSQAAFAAKIKGDGSATVWANVYGNTTAKGAAITTDTGGDVFLAGVHSGMVDFGGGPLSAMGSSTNAFAAKLNPSGKYVWAHSYGSGSAVEANGIAVDSKGRAIVTGAFEGKVDFGLNFLTSAGQDDVFVAKLDTQGCQYWAQSFGDIAEQSSNAIAVDSTDAVVIGGNMFGTVNFGPGPLTAPMGAENLFLAKFGP